MRDKLWRAERDEIHQQGLDARKRERERKKEVKALQKAKQPIPSELQTPILDPEVAWKADQEELKKQFSLQLDEQDEKDEEEIQFIIDIAGDENLQWLRQDYIPLSESSEDSGDSGDSSDSSSESQYSTDF